MWNKTRIKEIVSLSVFLVVAFGIGISSTLINRTPTQTSAEASTNWDQYCRDGVYYVKSPLDGSEITCGRAPNCDDTSYEDTASIEWRRNGQCWVEDYYGGDRCKANCAGHVPLCCYKMNETKNAEDCPFPERGYCMRDQCKGVVGDSNCGAQQGRWCVDINKCVEHRSQIPKLSLEDALLGRGTPLNSPTPDDEPENSPTSQPPTATPTSRPGNQSTPTPTTRPSGGGNTTTPGVTRLPIVNPSVTPTRIPNITTNPNTNNNLNNNPNLDPNNSNNSIIVNPRPTDRVVLPNTQLPTINVDLPNIPNIALKPPKQMLQETVNEEQITKLNRATDLPLNAARNTFITVKTYDQQLETTVESWIDYIRRKIIELIN